MKPFAVAIFLTAGLLFNGSAQAGLLSPDDEQAYQQAFRAAREDKFDLAYQFAGGASNQLPAKVLRWMEFADPQSNASFADITAFIAANPTWPQLSTLQRRAEEAITLTTPNQEVLRWFAAYPPITVDGRTAYGKALLETGQAEKAVKVLRETWIEGGFGVLQERQFLERYSQYLRNQDHIARLDRLLWDRQDDAAQRMILRVDAAYRLVAQARFALMKGKGDAEAALAKVPPDLRDDPGLVFERLRWRRQKEMDDEAIALLKHPARNKVRPDMWWTERSILARRALQQGHAAEAYRLARDHGQTEGSGYAEAEWLAGWIALRFLDDPNGALAHFTRLYERVQYPVSRARGAYWAGRAAEARGNSAEADKWYSAAAQHVTSYYGQLAAARLSKDQLWSLPADPVPTAQEAANFDRQELTRIVRLLAEIGETATMRTFLLRLNDLAVTPGQRALTANLASSLGREDVAVNLARRSDREGITLVSQGFPVPALPMDGPAEKALVLALIRQESAFYYEAVSPVGARGLMQLMPATAEKVAKGLKMNVTPAALTTDPGLNVRLGSAYLAEVLEDFNGSYILALAAYNAGPSRARKWMRDFGDPRDTNVDAVDWVEMIPFTETRNYVQRVMENVQVYRHRLGVAELAWSLERDLKR